MPPAQQYSIDPFSAAELTRVRRKVDSISGAGVTNGPDFITISPPPPAQRSSPAKPSGGGARIFYLVEDGTGESGSKVLPCTFKYDVYDPNSADTSTDTGFKLIQAGVALTGHGRRDSVGKMHAATWGIGDIDSDGNVRLVFADETNFRRDCVPPP
jgi:hypothetical protein